MQTKITKLLGITHPVFAGAMAWISDGKLAASVSNAGGLGIIAASSMPPELLREQILIAKSLTNKPFGVNVMMRSDTAPAVAALCCELKVPVITTGAGNPAPYIAKWKEAGCMVIPVVPNAKVAKKMCELGAVAVVAEGAEAGGHIGELTTMALVPQVVDAVTIPVIAAGGVGDARGFAAAIALGADAVQCGTIFICADESPAHKNYKQLVLDYSGDLNSVTLVTGRSGGHPVRTLKSEFSTKLAKMEADGASVAELEAIATGSLQNAVVKGDLVNGSFMSGQIAPLVKKLQPSKDILEDLVSSTELYLKDILNGRGIILG